MNKLRKDIQYLIDEIVDNLIDTFGIDYQGYEFDRKDDIPLEKLAKLSEMLIVLNKDDFSFLLEYPAFETSLLESLAGHTDTREMLPIILDCIAIKHCNSDIERFINYELFRRREEYYESRGRKQMTDPETGEYYWGKA